MSDYIQPLEDFIQDIVDTADLWTRSDLQAYVEARCITTGECMEEILEQIDTLTSDWYGIII